MWLSPSFAVENAVGQFVQPIPTKTVENINKIAELNQGVDIKLWVDSRRLTSEQIDWLKELSEACPSKNLIISDLRTIPEYNNYYLFNSPDANPDWRLDKHSLIWRQVDAARILACLQGNYDQSFYSDADITNLDVNSKEIQNRIAKHGVVLSGGISNGDAFYENQMFGFEGKQKDSFKLLYNRTLAEIQLKRENGYGAYIGFINAELKDKAGIDTKEVVWSPEYDGTVALHSATATTSRADSKSWVDGIPKKGSGFLVEK